MKTLHVGLSNVDMAQGKQLVGYLDCKDCIGQLELDKICNTSDSMIRVKVMLFSTTFLTWAFGVMIPHSAFYIFHWGID